MRSILKIALLLMVTIPVSCKRFANPFAGSDKVLAEVGGEKLYVHDLSSIFTPDMAPEDSVKILGSYVDRWVKMQLKIQEAERMFESSQQDITVTLAIPKTAGNELQGLTATVDWIFTAEVIPNNPPTPDIPDEPTPSLDTVNHYAYIIGRKDGLVHPEAPITRAEVAAATCRLLERSADQTYIRSHIGELRTFADVTESHWAYWYAMEAANGHDYTKSGGSESWSRTYR